jgi:DNA-binding Lrp family transcriptional regulator
MIIDEEQPITTYKISKLLNESFNAVKYNIQKLEKHKAILAFKKDENKTATYYVPNKLFTEMDDIIEYLEPIISAAMYSADLDENNAKFNFKILLNLIIDDINGKGKINKES